MLTKERRTFPRASTLLPFTVRRLKTNTCDEKSCRIGKDVIVIDDALPPALEDEALNMWLNMINAKLDCLIRNAAPKREDVMVMTCEPLNISGSGMSLITRELFNIGDMLEIRVILQAYPSKILCLYGEVVRVEGVPKKAESFNVSVKFQGMSDEVRNEILKFDFKKQRKKLITSPKCCPLPPEVTRK
jgi:hypothetical protein